jgi:AzlC protein
MSVCLPRASRASAGSFKNPGSATPTVEFVLEESRRGVARDSLSVGIAVGAYGVAFGAASVAAGLSVLQTALLSLLAFTGGTQFAVVGVISGGGTPGTALSSGLLLGARNTLYAMRLAPLLQVRGVRRFFAAQGTIAESTAMALARRDRALSRVAFWWTFASIYLFWNATTLAGAIGAQALGDPREVRAGRSGAGRVPGPAGLQIACRQDRTTDRRRGGGHCADPHPADPPGCAGARVVRGRTARRSAAVNLGYLC